MEAQGLARQLELAEYQRSTADDLARARQSAFTLCGNATLELPADISLAFMNFVKKLQRASFNIYFLTSPNMACADAHASLTLVRSIYSPMSTELLLCC